MNGNSRSRLGIAALLAFSVCAGATVIAQSTQAKEDTPRFQAVVVAQLSVSDLDRSVAFYRDTLGLELELMIDALRWAKFKTAVPGLTIGLNEVKNLKLPAPKTLGPSSLNLAVPDADLARQQLEAKGVRFLGPTTEIPGVVRLADFVDPDGHCFRLAGPPKAAQK